MISSPEIKAITYQYKTDPNEQSQIPDVFIHKYSKKTTAYTFNTVIIYDKRNSWKCRYAAKTHVNVSME